MLSMSVLRCAATRAAVASTTGAATFAAGRGSGIARGRGGGAGGWRRGRAVGRWCGLRISGALATLCTTTPATPAGGCAGLGDAIAVTDGE